MLQHLIVQLPAQSVAMLSEQALLTRKFALVLALLISEMLLQLTTTPRTVQLLPPQLFKLEFKLLLQFYQLCT